jgi:Ni/Co efflux regulator RcnB
LFKKTVSSLVLFGICCTPLAALAQHDDHPNDRRDDNHDAHQQQYVHHNEWRKGYHMRSEDWNRGERIDDYRTYHLSAPPRGYEWRQVDGNYVLAAAATGVIASVIVASAH